MGTKSICDKCRKRWSYGGKLYCIEEHRYTSNKKECKYFVGGENDKYWRGKDGKNRKGRSW